MSERSYWENVARGVTGPKTRTCVPAAFDRLSLHHDVSPETYERYSDLLSDVRGYMTGNLISTNMMSRLIEWEQRLFRDLGVAASEVVAYRAKREKDFVRCITELVSGGFRTVVYLDLGCKHAVGLVPLGDGTYRTISTWDPFRDNASTTARCIFPLLEQMQPQTVHYGSVMMIEKAANIRAFPPERPI